MSGCHLKDGVQVHIHRVRILPDRLRAARLPEVHHRAARLQEVHHRAALRLAFRRGRQVRLPEDPDQAGILPRAGAAAPAMQAVPLHAL